ncbi:phosphate signaling complex PhoU family protein [Candidatus Methanodesulfokora washburnensis]|jgi:phosphate uptake regulator|uniref:Phosphate uptake regulator PhoU n=1 Tax=Candidatus Methanodesulfokora washburnensis TaxID=2478471 RepID=A0A429GJ06_9CREN|nr:phosphate uptake regulator PhoU [Candidatus Methanodesulfokores washburnensis]RSN73860.1 phosphate uptake regulator PhoU [Candidatus Methanodesulfokores washburnensis]
MIVRRVQAVGGGSLSVSLPKSWVVRNGIRKGDNLLMEERADGSLLIFADRKRKERETELEFVDERSLETILSRYLLGFDTIRIRFPKGLSIEQRKRIMKFISRLPGMELEDESSDLLIFRCTMDPASMKPREMLLKMHEMAYRMLEDAMKAASTGDENLRDLVSERDDVLDRIYFTVVRMARLALIDAGVMARLGVNPVELMDLRVCAMLEEGIGDIAVELAYMDVSSDIIMMNKLRDLKSRVSKAIETGSEEIAYESKTAGLELLEEVKEAGGKMAGILERVIRAYIDISDLCIAWSY